MMVHLTSSAAMKRQSKGSTETITGPSSARYLLGTPPCSRLNLLAKKELMAFVNAVLRVLPDGITSKVFPFHISFEGLEKNIICRDDEDCDQLVKTIAICSRRKNVIVIIYAVVSNHAHVAVLAKSYNNAKAYGEEVKRVYSMFFRRKYGETKALKETDIDVQFLDTEWYLRNALAYIPRNALDNGAKNIADYKWTGFRAFFRKKHNHENMKKVADMSFREWRAVFHTGDNLSGTPWLLNKDCEIEPFSFCDINYLEQAFGGDESFFYKCVGTVNVPEMTQKLVVSPRTMKTDADFMKELELISSKWFNSNVGNLAESQKVRMLPYVFRSSKTSIAQLARAFGMEREKIRRLLNVKKVSQ